MYYEAYVEDCQSKVKSFLQKEETTKFVANFMLKYQFNTDDNWIDIIIEGQLIYTNPIVYEGE